VPCLVTHSPTSLTAPCWLSARAMAALELQPNLSAATRPPIAMSHQPSLYPRLCNPQSHISASCHVAPSCFNLTPSASSSRPLFRTDPPHAKLTVDQPSSSRKLFVYHRIITTLVGWMQASAEGVWPRYSPLCCCVLTALPNDAPDADQLSKRSSVARLLFDAFGP
jgi:hypothetical protein